MKHFASPAFWEYYECLPHHIREAADKCFEFLKQDESYPSLHIKKVGTYYSARVGKGYRVLGLEVEGACSVSGSGHTPNMSDY